MRRRRSSAGGSTTDTFGRISSQVSAPTPRETADRHPIAGGSRTRKQRRSCVKQGARRGIADGCHGSRISPGRGSRKFASLKNQTFSNKKKYLTSSSRVPLHGLKTRPRLTPRRESSASRRRTQTAKFLFIPLLLRKVSLILSLRSQKDRYFERLHRIAMAAGVAMPPRSSVDG